MGIAKSGQGRERERGRDRETEIQRERVLGRNPAPHSCGIAAAFSEGIREGVCEGGMRTEKPCKQLCEWTATSGMVLIKGPCRAHTQSLN